MTDLLKLTWVLLGVLGLAACGRAVGPDDDDDEVYSVRLAEATVPLQELPGFESVELDGDVVRVTFGDASAAVAFEPGAILLSTTDGGLLRTVESSSVEGATVVAETTQASMVQAFEELQIGGVVIEVRSEERGPVDLDGTLLASSGVEVALGGSLDPSFDLEPELDLGGFRIDSFSLVGTMDVEADIEMSAALLTSVEWEGDVLVWQGAPTPFAIGYLAGTAWIELRAAVEVSSEAGLEVSTAVQWGGGLEAGALYERGDGWSPVWEVTQDHEWEDPSFSFPAELGLEASLRPELHVRLYAVAGPRLMPSVFVRGAVDASPPASWTLSAGMEGAVAGSVSILDFELEDLSLLLASYEVELASGTFGEDPGMCSVPSTSDTNLYEIQTGDVTGSVTVEDVVVTGVAEDGFWVQEPDGGPCSGLWVYTGSAPGLSVSTAVTVEGTVDEYYGLTQIAASSGGVTATGSAMPVQPATVAVPELQPGSAERWEGVLVTVPPPLEVTVVPTSETFGEWEVTDGKLVLAVDNQMLNVSGFAEGDEVTELTGVLNYDFERFKMAPRDLDDLSIEAPSGDDDDDIVVNGMTMLLVSAGTFDMGCTPAHQADCGADETPVHSVTLTNDFWLGETEVTQAQWEAVIGNEPSDFSTCGDDCPVEDVNWWSVVAFVNELSSGAGLDECYSLSGCNAAEPGELFVCDGVSINSPSGTVYDCEGYRLPTEAEWEYAARSGQDLRYAGSNTLGDVAWYSGNSGGTPHAVATKQPNDWGFYDMTGNVVEWCTDWRDDDYYGVSPSSDPAGPTSGTARVARGGYWDNTLNNLRVADRGAQNPEIGNEASGFRVARTSP